MAVVIIIYHITGGMVIIPAHHTTGMDMDIIMDTGGEIIAGGGIIVGGGIIQGVAVMIMLITIKREEIGALKDQMMEEEIPPMMICFYR